MRDRDASVAGGEDSFPRGIPSDAQNQAQPLTAPAATPLVISFLNTR